jgi:hypothetical protein
MRTAIAAAAILAAAVPASAEDKPEDKEKIEGTTPKYVFAKQEEVKGVVWRAIAEAGLVFTTGNSETTTATGGVRVSRRTRWNKFSLDASGAYAKSGVRGLVTDNYGDGMIHDPSQVGTIEAITAETLNGRLRYDRFVTDLDSFYIAAIASRDLPAGKRSAFGGQIGYSRHLIKAKTAEALAELGYDVSRVRLVVGPPLTIHSARAFIGVKKEMIAGTVLDASFEVLTNLNSVPLPTMKDGSIFQVTTLNGKLAVSAKMSKNLAVQTSIESHYNHRPGPAPLKNLAMGVVIEAASLDTLMKASLIYNFF